MTGRDVNEESTTRHLIHGYYAATSYMDAQLGKVFDAVDDLGLQKNTIIVFWGDHGWHLGDHGMWCKHTNYEQAARIPVIVVAPGLAQDEKTEAMIETVDIFPTLCDLAGIESPKEGDGISFAKVIHEPSATGRSHVTHVYPRGKKLGRAIRDSRYRMVQWRDIGGTLRFGCFVRGRIRTLRLRRRSTGNSKLSRHSDPRFSHPCKRS